MTTRLRESGIIILFTAALCGCTQAHDESNKVTATQQTNASIVVAKVIAKEVNRKEKLPADLIAYRDVAIYPKVPGFVKTISVDRGSIVRSGQLLVSLMAPELNDQKAQSANQAKAALEERNQSKADLESLVDEQKSVAENLKAEKDTYNRLKEASAYPGMIAGNDLEIAQQKAAADEAKLHSYDKKRKALEARIRSLDSREKSALDSARSSTAVESYLQITAPFDGVITERNVHEGSFVNAPTNEKVAPLLRIQQLSLLRLVVPVPEADVGGIVPGASVTFTVPAFKGETFDGIVKRVGGSLDLNNRTMPVELDVPNPSRRLAPGMYAEVNWPVVHAKASLYVPKTSVVTTTEKTFVVRIKDGVTEWIDVKPGAADGDLIEVFGNLQPGDEIAVRGTDELRAGKHVSVTDAPAVSTNGKTGS